MKRFSLLFLAAFLMPSFAVAASFEAQPLGFDQSNIDLAEGSSFGEEYMIGKYREETKTSMRIEITKALRLETNFRINYQRGVSATPYFKKRLKSKGATGEYETRGTFQLSWELKGEKWTCDYPLRVYLETFQVEEEVYADMTLAQPKTIIYPTSFGSCPHQGIFEEDLAFKKVEMLSPEEK